MTKKILAPVIIIFAVILAIASVWNESPIVDEIPHIGAGYSYVVKGDYRLNPEHPPLAKDIAGLALLPLHLKQSPFQTEFWTKDINGQWNFGRNLIFNSGNNAIILAHAAKLPMLIFFVLSALIIYLWTKKLYGFMVAIIALFLFSFSPTVIAHSRFVTTDIPALFGILFATYFFINFLKTPDRHSFLLAAFAFGVAQLTKFSAFLLVPFFGGLAIFWAITQVDKLKALVKYIFFAGAIVVAGYIFVVWPVYGLHIRNYPPERQKSDTSFHLASYGNKLVANPIVWMSDKPFIRPLAQYGLGLLMVTQRSVGGNTTYFLGEVKNVAWKKYFPIVYFIKEPLAFWAFVLIALISLVVGARIKQFRLSKITEWPKEHFTEFAMLLWLAIYWYSSIKANLNIGVRHLLPTYGFVYILVSGQLNALIQKIKIKTPKVLYVLYFIIFSLLSWYLYENLNIYPYYLTYFNQVVGGSAGGHNYVVDSNLDWGQDLRRLNNWVDKNNIPSVNLDYFGWADPAYYLKDKYIWMSAGKFHSAEEFLRDYPDGGYIAVSASFFMGTSSDPLNNYLWLNAYKPITVIGNSIFIWHITK